MKPFKSKWANHGQFDEHTDTENRRPKKAKRRLTEDDEDQFQRWSNRPTDVREFLDDEEVHT